jgi:hypothetical protein
MMAGSTAGVVAWWSWFRIEAVFERMEKSRRLRANTWPSQKADRSSSLSRAPLLLGTKRGLIEKVRL